MKMKKNEKTVRIDVMKKILISILATTFLSTFKRYFCPLYVHLHETDKDLAVSFLIHFIEIKINEKIWWYNSTTNKI